MNIASRDLFKTDPKTMNFLEWAILNRESIGYIEEETKLWEWLSTHTNTLVSENAIVAAVTEIDPPMLQVLLGHKGVKHMQHQQVRVLRIRRLLGKKLLGLRFAPNTGACLRI